MPRPFEEKLRSGWWWLEQLAHFVAFGLIAFGIGKVVSPTVGTVLAMGLGLVREAVQNLGDKEGDHRDLLVDLIASQGGAVAGGIMAWLL